jgi:hypothetical protein
VAYTVPTANQIQAKYPAFAAVPDATIDLYIADAPVDTTWLERDYTNAIMLWTAHTMTLNGIGAGTDAEIAAAGLSGVTRLKSGTLDVSFSGEGAGSGSGYQATVYGRQYYELLRKNKGGPRVVTGPVDDCGWGPLAVQNNGVVLPWGS